MLYHIKTDYLHMPNDPLFVMYYPNYGFAFRFSLALPYQENSLSRFRLRLCLVRHKHGAGCINRIYIEFGGLRDEEYLRLKILTTMLPSLYLLA